MNFSPRSILFCAIIAAMITLVILFGISTDTAHSAPPPPDGTETPEPLPPNQPERGIIYDRLERGNDRVCKGMFKLRDSIHCTHGPDPAPLGVNVRNRVAPVTLGNAPAAVSAIQCDGDGTSGYRTQVMYARGSDKTDRYDAYLASFIQWAEEADQIYQDSAAETGGYRRIRFVHDSNCNLLVYSATLTWTGSIDFNKLVTALSLQGYNRSDRKYMIFMDDNLYCGIGSLWGNDSSSSSNPNNSGPSYARADSGCWGGSLIAHEHMHNLGAVQHSAPHSTYLQNQSSGNTWHCSDEYDRMCYPDAPGVVMSYPCSDSSHDRLFDCNHDDYFHTNPAPGSYLAAHWNAADNRFLIAQPAALFRIYFPAIIR